MREAIVTPLHILPQKDAQNVKLILYIKINLNLIAALWSTTLATSSDDGDFEAALENHGDSFARLSRAFSVIFGSDLGKLLTFDLPEAGSRATEKWQKFDKIHDDVGLGGRWTCLPCFLFYYCAEGEKSTDRRHHKITQDYTIAKR